MKQTRSLSFLLLLVLTMTIIARGQTGGTTINAASCQETSVNAVINGPTHTAANGDTIIIPAGTCTWTSELSIPVGITLTGSGTPNTGPNSFSAGTLSTIIIDNAGSSAPMIAVTNLTSGERVTLAMLDVEPNSNSTALYSPITVSGTCNSSGCANMRIDNVAFGLTTQWTESGNGSPADWMIRTDNVFGVIDHSTLPSGSAVELLNANLSAYLGVGGYGDNSWAQPDSFGGANVLYIENNTVYTNQSVNDCDTAPVGGAVGGCRVSGRFNIIYPEAGFFAGFYVHGLDTDGRPQGGRQIEAYGNQINCNINGSCTSGVSWYRSGTGFTFGNTLTTSNGGFYNTIAQISVYRTVFTGTAWGACGGSGSWDTNDGVVYYSGTNSGSTGSTTLTDSTKSWTTNQLIPVGAPYSVHDTTKGWWAEIASNTATTLTIQASIPEQTNTFNNGDSYTILRATVCADQGGRGAGNYVTGATPSPASSLSQALDPIYEWDNAVSTLFHGNITSDTGRTIANRDWYTDGSNGKPLAQTSPATPFNGTSGVGFGTLANRPSTCTLGVGYFATDQGSWNKSGNTFGQGQLFVCTPTGWTMHYQPYTYPHPLTTGGPLGPNPPGNVTETMQSH